ncbi:MAG: hypothetical protein CM1200mP41_11890 [Gammaproteobacteria bacterium]|nr:MAG: hypothetical protein CM1200mP41_11890 [Gammaproteobacteria bacterium]
METATQGRSRANLGFVYVTSEHVAALGGILDYLKVASGIDHWVGTSGIGIVACDKECYDSPGIAILTGAFPTDGFRILSTVVDAVSECSEDVQTWFGNNFSTVGIVHADPHNPHLQQLIPDLSDPSGGRVSTRRINFDFGRGASTDLRWPDNWWHLWRSFFREGVNCLRTEPGMQSAWAQPDNH